MKLTILKNVTAKEIKKFLNETYVKVNGELFNYNDVCGYIHRKRTPRWYGNLYIEKNLQHPNVKLYNVLTNKRNGI